MRFFGFLTIVAVTLGIVQATTDVDLDRQINKATIEISVFAQIIETYKVNDPSVFKQLESGVANISSSFDAGWAIANSAAVYTDTRVANISNSVTELFDAVRALIDIFVRQSGLSPSHGGDIATLLRNLQLAFDRLIAAIILRIRDLSEQSKAISNAHQVDQEFRGVIIFYVGP